MSHPARSIPSRRETEARTSEEFPKAARDRSPHPPPPYAWWGAFWKALQKYPSPTSFPLTSRSGPNPTY